MLRKGSGLRNTSICLLSISCNYDHHLTSSTACPRSALTFCVLLNERTSLKTDRIASLRLASFQLQARRVIISSCQECREFPAFSLFRCFERVSGTCDGGTGGGVRCLPAAEWLLANAVLTSGRQIRCTCSSTACEGGTGATLDGLS